MSVSLVAREAGIAASQLFQWRKAYTEGSLVAVGANEPVVPASELQEALWRVKQLEAALGRKTLENEILKEAVDFAKSKKWIARSLLLRHQHACSANHKTIYRVMRDHGLLLYRLGQRPVSTRKHDGQIAVSASSMRWCSDGIEVSCDNGERVRVAFALDCCDREVMSWVATTKGIDAGLSIPLVISPNLPK